MRGASQQRAPVRHCRGMLPRRGDKAGSGVRRGKSPRLMYTPLPLLPDPRAHEHAEEKGLKDLV